MPIFSNAYPNTSGLVIDNELGVHSYTDSTDTETGAVQVWGGIGVQGNVHAGNVYAGSIFTTGSLTILGNLSMSGNVGGNSATFNYLTVTNSTFNANSVMNKSYVDSMALVFGI